MTKEEKEAAAAAAKAAAEAAEAAEKAAIEERKSLVRMVKLGEDDAYVHPSCVKAHESVGWKVGGAQ